MWLASACDCGMGKSCVVLRPNTPARHQLAYKIVIPTAYSASVSERYVCFRRVGLGHVNAHLLHRCWRDAALDDARDLSLQYVFVSAAFDCFKRL